MVQSEVSLVSLSDMLSVSLLATAASSMFKMDTCQLLLSHRLFPLQVLNATWYMMCSPYHGFWFCSLCSPLGTSSWNLIWPILRRWYWMQAPKYFQWCWKPWLINYNPTQTILLLQLCVTGHNYNINIKCPAHKWRGHSERGGSRKCEVVWI